MKSKANFKEAVTAKISIFLVLVISLSVIACDSAKNKKLKEKKSKLTEEVLNAEEDLVKIAEMQKKEMKRKVDSVVTDFNSQLEKYQSSINKRNQKMNAETRELLDKIKADRDSLNIKMSEMKNQTEKTWSDFKKEMEQDIVKFSASVKSFFKETEKSN
jgi:glutamate racemase